MLTSLTTSGEEIVRGQSSRPTNPDPEFPTEIDCISTFGVPTDTLRPPSLKLTDSICCIP